MPINNNEESLRRLRARRIPNFGPNFGLSAEEVDKINRTTPKLSREEKRLERMYERPVNDTELWKKINK